MGISPMDAVRLFLRYVADHQELPFTEVSVVVSAKNKDSDILEIVRDQIKDRTSISVK
jgi:RHH-type rel operon transcriptional repressor/antitoxin RelB